MHLHVHAIYMHLHLHAATCECINVYIHVRLQASTCTCVHMYMHLRGTGICMFMHLHVVVNYRSARTYMYIMRFTLFLVSRSSSELICNVNSLACYTTDCTTRLAAAPSLPMPETQAIVSGPPQSSEGGNQPSIRSVIYKGNLCSVPVEAPISRF